MTRSDGRVALAMGFLCFLAVSALGHHTWGTVDAIQRLAVTRSILTTGSVITPEFGAVKYGPLQPVLMLPSYALGYGVALLGGLAEPGRVGYRFTAFLFTPLVVSVLVGLWYGFARRWGHRPAAAAIGAWTLFWCTLVLPYSRLLFSDLLSATMLFAGASCLLPPASCLRRRLLFVRDSFFSAPPRSTTWSSSRSCFSRRWRCRLGSGGEGERPTRGEAPWLPP
jgi:hypothetical protein